MIILPSSPNTRYHELRFTSSDPIITKRCICFDSLNIVNNGFVKETFDNEDRCMRLDFFVQENAYYQAVDFPSIIKYSWTDSSLIQTLYQSDGLLFSTKSMVRPNKREYILCKLRVSKIKNYFNDILVDSVICKSIKIEEADFFMMYSGCQKKYNGNYRIEF